ncbi:MAG: hypothetical protein R6V55_04315 [Desulfovermiculus sp.]
MRWGRKTLLGVVAAAAASVFLHFLPAWLLPGPRTSTPEHTVFIVDVASPHKPQAGDGNLEEKPEESAEDQNPTPAEDLEQVRLRGGSGGFFPKAGSAEEDLKKILAGVQSRVQPVWEGAKPPGPGRVDIYMELSSQGDLDSAWVADGQGHPQLPAFVLDVVRRAQPFPLAGVYLRDRMVVGCTFAVYE